MRCASTAALIAAVVSVVSSNAQGSPLFELVGGVQSSGGFNARSVAASSASCYFNPAFLPDADADLELGLFVLSDEIGIHLNARPSASADIPVDSVDMEGPGGTRYPTYGVPTIWLESGKPADPPDVPLRARPRQAAGSSGNLRLYQVLGFVRKIWDDRVAFGLYAMIPYSRFTGAAAFFSDEREQYFSNSLHPELYSDRLTATSLSFGLGARLHEVLSVGATFTLALRTAAVTPTYLNDVGNFEAIMVDSDVGVNASLAPHFGMVLRPASRLQFSATVHSPQQMNIETDFSFLLRNGIEQRAKLRFTHAYLPWTFAVGGAYDLIKGDTRQVSLVATGMLALWSNYVDRHSERPSTAYAWYNTLSTVVGGRYVEGPSSTHLDVGYYPSPVPDQTGRTNYVDNDRLGVSGGYSYRFPLFGGHLRAGVQAQVHRLLPRETLKRDPKFGGADLVRDEVPDDAVLAGEPLAGREGLQTNNPGWPGFSSEGWLVGAGVNASIAF